MRVAWIVVWLMMLPIDIWLIRAMMVVVMMIMVSKCGTALLGLLLVVFDRALARFGFLMLPRLLGKHHFFHLLYGHSSLNID